MLCQAVDTVLSSNFHLTGKPYADVIVLFPIACGYDDDIIFTKSPYVHVH